MAGGPCDSLRRPGARWRTRGGRPPPPPPPRGRQWLGSRLRGAHRRRGARPPPRVGARSHARSHLWGQGVRRSLTTCNVRRATRRILAYVCGPVTPFATVELTVYPYECDAFGHLNQAALLTLLERARWDALARGPGMDLFERNGVWPAVRKTVVEYKAAVLS